MGWGSREKHERREEDVLKGGEEDASAIIIPDLWRGRRKIITKGIPRFLYQSWEFDTTYNRRD